MKPFDITPYALPNCAPGEFRFEEPRDVAEIALTCRGPVPRGIQLHYLRDHWPATRLEEHLDPGDPGRFGWLPMDDWFNGDWCQAQVRRSVEGNTVRLRFKGLAAEGLAATPAGYDVDFRRTVGLRLALASWDQVKHIAIHTASAPERTKLRVELDAGQRTPGDAIELSGYNARVVSVRAHDGVAVAGKQVTLMKGNRRGFDLTLDHMTPSHPYAHDEGHLQLTLGDDRVTLSLEALRERGPIWYARAGIFVAEASDATAFADYRRRHSDARTINTRVSQRAEHSYPAAFSGQPRPHAVAYSFGCMHSPQRFWLDVNGDLLLHKTNLTRLDKPGVAAKRYLNKGNARLFFGLHPWIATARFTDPGPAPVYNRHLKKGDLTIEQKCLCVPLLRPIAAGELGFDDPTVALIHFRFSNTGDQAAEARLPLRYSENSRHSSGSTRAASGEDDYRVPQSPLVPLALRRGRATSRHRGKDVLRFTYETTMRARSDATSDATGAELSCRLQPGESCEVVLKVPYVALTSAAEMRALKQLRFATCHRQVVRFWRAENERGSRIATPVPQLNALYASHLTHVQISDIAMPDDADLINTSVGSSRYGNFSNESCMIVHELDQRGLRDEARRRLDLWVKYQGTVPQPGNFVDYDGMYYGAGGFEQGNYNQHHGWVLWCLAEHFLLTGDEAWFGGVVDSVIAGADWIFRQQRETMRPLPHSRGWERGLLPAGSLEDVTDFQYWLSTNCLTWRGADTAARALERFGHPEAERLRAASDALRADLVEAMETSRQNAPLVPLRDGRWVPHYPSRLYCRGRDQGWIREVLEGAVYLLLSGLYDPRSEEASWILDDFQDNLYLTPPYGYPLRNPETNYVSRGGFSYQPTLLAGLLPHLERDEPEIYIWMFFNSFCSVFREEISGFIEHPLPELGYTNDVVFKTSDEANSVVWLRYMFVYWNERLLHFGRALPRSWFAAGEDLEITGVRTYFGDASVRYEPQLSRRKMVAHVTLVDTWGDPRILVRFRHPHSAAIKSVRVNGRRWKAFDPHAGDVDITGSSGRVEVEAVY